MINNYYESNHGLVAEIDGRSYLLTEDIIKKYAIKPNFGDGNKTKLHNDNSESQAFTI